MAKQSVINRNKRRIALVEKFRTLRQKLRMDSIDESLSEDKKREAMFALQKLPRDSSPSRRRNRCICVTRVRGRSEEICGRPRGVDRHTGQCRIHMRNNVMFGLVTGMHKASW